MLGLALSEGIGVTVGILLGDGLGAGLSVGVSLGLDETDGAKLGRALAVGPALG